MQKEAIGKKGLVFNVQKYSVHDGPGIRTIVFLKGCPLYCWWCSNPEGQGYKPEMAYHERFCTKCYQCIEVCPESAIIKKDDGTLETIRSLCTSCGKCVDICPANARKIFGDYVSVDEVLADVNKDSVFYRRSGGGLTVSGGEPLAQADFVRELLKKAKEEYRLHTAIESTCYAQPEVLRSVLQYVDYVFCDLKHIDSVKHQELTGVSNELILNNIRMIVDDFLPAKELVLRLPLIPTINNDTENLLGIARFIKSLNKDVPLEVLPYHELGKGKYEALGKTYSLANSKIEAPSKEYLEHVHEIFKSQGVNIINT